MTETHASVYSLAKAVGGLVVSGNLSVKRVKFLYKAYSKHNKVEAWLINVT